MANLPISTTKVAPQSLSWKEVKQNAENEVKRIKTVKDNIKSNLLPQGLEMLKKALDAVVKSAEDMINREFEKQFGMTIIQAKYKLDEGVQLFKKYKELGSSTANKVIDKKKKNDKTKDKEKLKETKAAVKTKLTKWLEAQTNEVYSLFFVVQFKDLLDNVKTVISQMTNGGVDLIQEIIESFRNLKSFYPNSGDFVAAEKEIKGTLTVDYAVDDGTAQTLIGELAKSAKSEGGDKVLSSTKLAKKGLNSLAKTILSLMTSLLGILVPLYTLIYNYNTNKAQCEGRAIEGSGDILEKMAALNGQSDVIDYKNEDKIVNIANTDSKKQKQADLAALKEIRAVEANDENSKASYNPNKDNGSNSSSNTSVANKNGNLVSSNDGKFDGNNDNGGIKSSIGLANNGSNGNMSIDSDDNSSKSNQSSVGGNSGINSNSNNRNGSNSSNNERGTLSVSQSGGGDSNSSSDASEETANNLKLDETDTNFEEVSINQNFGSTIDWNNEDTQHFDMESMKFLNPQEDLDTMTIPTSVAKTADGRKGRTTTSSDKMYVAPHDAYSDEILSSEIKRVTAKIEYAKNYCKLDMSKPLYSISTKTNGGRMINLEHSGDNKKELIEAVLNINGGKRL